MHQKSSPAQNPSTLHEEALRLAGAGFSLTAIGEDKTPAHSEGFTERTPAQVTQEALDEVEAGRAQGIRLELGARGARPLPDGTSRVPLALEISAQALRTEAWHHRWEDVIGQFGLRDLRATLESGVVQTTPGGGRRLFFEVVTDDVAQTMPAVSAALWGKKASPVTMAQLLTENAIIAPSHGSTHPSGLPYLAAQGSFIENLPELTVADVDALGVVLTQLSDHGLHETVTTLFGWTTRARQIATAYRHVSNPRETLDLLRQHKWSVVRGSLPGEVSLSRPGAVAGDVHAKIGGARRQYGQATILTSSDETLPKGYLNAFELNALLEHGGNAEKGAWALQSRVHMPHLILSAVSRPNINISGDADTDELRGALVNAVASARSTVDLTAPMVLRHVDATGKSLELVIPRRGLPPIRITERKALGLFLRVCQPVMGFRELKDADGKPTGVQKAVNAHHIPPEVAKLAFEDVLESASVNSVKMFATEPVLLQNGRTVSKPGYHPVEQVLISIPQRDVQNWAENYYVPETPTLEEAQAALDLLATDVLHDFPFTDEGDLSRALLLLLSWAAPTLVHKRAPWMVTAPDKGTGKSLLCEVGRIIATGSAVAAEIVPFKSRDVENEKIIASAAMAGVRFVSADNVTTGASFNSEIVTVATTKGDGEHPFRVLGTNDYIYPAGLTYVFAGNSISPGGDTNRRFMYINLEVKHGLAFERTGFKHRNLIQYVHDNRPKLLAAVHTVLAYELQNPHGQGLPAGMPRYTLSSFESWSDIFVGALSHLTLAFKEEDPQDPTKLVTRTANAGELVSKGRQDFVDSADEEAEEWGEFLGWLEMVTKDKPLAAGEITDALWPHGAPHPRVDLPVSVQDIRKWPEASFARRMGNALKGHRNQKFPCGDKIFKLVSLSPASRDSKSKKSMLWKVEASARRGTTTPVSTPSESWPTEPLEVF